jgi:hypothetical protein
MPEVFREFGFVFFFYANEGNEPKISMSGRQAVLQSIGLSLSNWNFRKE